VTTLAGSGVSGFADGIGAAATFDEPYGLAIDSSDAILYVSDNDTNTIRKIVIATGDVTTLAGTANAIGSADGTGAAAEFHMPEGLTMDTADNLYVVDRSNSTIRKVTPAGVVTTVGGTAYHVGLSEGVLPKPRFATLSGDILYLTARHGVMVMTLP
jgi:DNA-binding beta-propeller fold protein YncE